MTHSEDRQISAKLKKICSLLKGVKIKLGYKFGSTPHGYAHETILDEIRDLDYITHSIKKKIMIETRPDSPFEFKKSQTSEWETYRDNDNPWEDEEPPEDDSDFVVDTYYAIVFAKDIPKFIKDSREMINGEDQIDPLGDGKFHAAKVYVISKEVLPMGLGELISRMKESRNMTLHLILNKRSAIEFIEEFESMKSFFENKPDMWSRIC